MTLSQRAFVALGGLAVAALLAYPPYTFTAQNGVRFNLGHGFLFSPPFFESGSSSVPGNVNTVLLAVQICGVALVAGAGWLVAASRRA